MGPLPETNCGNKHILVLMDHFTKWCEAFPTPDQKASTVAKILVDRVFSRFGPPVVLHSDQGANVESRLMHEVCDVMGIKKTRTTAYHPQYDGQVERQNRTLQDMLVAFCTKHGNDWDLWLNAVVFAYNTSRQESQPGYL
jgi:transposase InsO family protein